MKTIFTNILQGKKYRVVQTVSPISHDLFLTIKLNCSDRIFSKSSMWKVALVSQHVQNFKKFTEGNARKFTVKVKILSALRSFFRNDFHYWGTDCIIGIKIPFSN